MRPAAAVLLLLTSCGALDPQLKRRRVVVRGGATAAARPTKRKIVAALATSTAAGSLAEFVTVDAGRVARMPSSLSFAEAAAMPTAYLTGLQALGVSVRAWVRVKPGLGLGLR